MSERDAFMAGFKAGYTYDDSYSYGDMYKNDYGKFIHTLHPQYEYANYRTYMESVWSGDMDADAIEHSIEHAQEAYERQFGRSDFDSVPVIEAYIGMVPFDFIYVDGSLYRTECFDWDAQWNWELVDDSWLYLHGCDTPVADIERTLHEWLG